MTAKIRVLIVDDFADTRESITKLLYFERDIEVVGSAPDAESGIQQAKELRPDIILMDINMPGMDGIAATEVISGVAPECAVIMMSVQGEADYLRRAMLAGAREYLVKPFTGDELAGAIRHVHGLAAEKRARLASMQPAAPAIATTAPQPASLSQGRVISLFSPKGGVGKTTIATNVAIALRMATGKKVVLVDCNLLFGDVGILLNIPAQKTIADLVPSISSLDWELMESILAGHATGMKVLLAPPRPELAELITGDHLKTIFRLLREHFDYVVVDTHPNFDDNMLTVLDLSDRILLMSTLEMPAIKNVKLFMEVVEALHYPQEKVMLVVNRSDSSGGINPSDIEANIRVNVAAKIVSAGQLMTAATNQGVPVVMSHRDSPVSKNIFELARKVMADADLLGADGGVADPAQSAREAKGGIGFGRLRLPGLAGLAAKKGAD